MKRIILLLLLFGPFFGTAQNVAQFGPIASSIHAYVFQDETIAYLNAVEGTGVTIPDTVKPYIDTLVRDLKGLPNPNYTTYNIWNSLSVIYPFYGGTAASHKFNLKDPRNADAAYRLIFTGSPTHSAAGTEFNGVNQTANTYFIVNGTPSHGFYINGGALSQSVGYNVGSEGFSGQNVSLIVRYNSSTKVTTAWFSKSTVAEGGMLVTPSSPTIQYGLYQGNYLSTGRTMTYNKSVLGSDSYTASTSITVSIYLGGVNLRGVPDWFINVRFGTYYLTMQKLTQVQYDALADAIIHYNKSLNR
jgi:hypothetical protein